MIGDGFAPIPSNIPRLASVFPFSTFIATRLSCLPSDAEPPPSFSLVRLQALEDVEEGDGGAGVGGGALGVDRVKYLFDTPGLGDLGGYDDGGV